MWSVSDVKLFIFIFPTYRSPLDALSSAVECVQALLERGARPSTSPCAKLDYVRLSIYSQRSGETEPSISISTLMTFV